MHVGCHTAVVCCGVADTMAALRVQVHRLVVVLLVGTLNKRFMGYLRGHRQPETGPKIKRNPEHVLPHVQCMPVDNLSEHGQQTMTTMPVLALQEAQLAGVLTC